MSRTCIVFGYLLVVALAQPDACMKKCTTQGSEGCCHYVGQTDGCQWCPQGHVDGASHVQGDAAANCHSGSHCEGWNWGQSCQGSCAPISPTPSPVPKPSPSPAGGKWVEVWHDDFTDCLDGAPNPKNWGYEHGKVRNREYQYYTDQNAQCVDDEDASGGKKLLITAKREPAPEGAEWTSSSITTNNKLSWSSGLFELRAKIDISPGSWPAWWFLGTSDQEWPLNGEIDAMEYYKGNVKANFISCCKWDDQKWNAHDDPVDSSWASEWHTYTMEWSENEIKISRDGTFVNSQQVDASSPWYNKPSYMLINLAIGGANGGDPDPSTNSFSYEVDYVRVSTWQATVQVSV